MLAFWQADITKLWSQEVSCHILKKKLIAERKVRKASEQWLRAELKSRVRITILGENHLNTEASHSAFQKQTSSQNIVQEDMESLFSAVRDVTLSKSFSGSKSHRIRQLLETLQLTCHGQHSPNRGTYISTQCTSKASSSDQTGIVQADLKSRRNSGRHVLQ